jgi:hypothetical protein
LWFASVWWLEARNWRLIIKKGAEGEPGFKLDNLIRLGERRKYTRF